MRAALLVLAAVGCIAASDVEAHAGVIRVRSHRLDRHRRRNNSEDCSTPSRSRGRQNNKTGGGDNNKQGVQQNGSGKGDGGKEGATKTTAKASASSPTLKPGFESLKAAVAAQLAAQDAGFSSSLSALEAKFTASSDNNFRGKGSNKVSQDSLTLDKSQVNIGSFSVGLPAAGQAESKTSKNNFINFCATQKMPLMNGIQHRVASCNPVIMGVVVPADKAPATRWAFPTQQQTIPANVNTTLKLNIQNIQTGTFTDAQSTYFGAPQTVNAEGFIIGHTHIVVNQVKNCQDGVVAKGRDFVFFKGIDAPAVDGVASITVVNGFPPGNYRTCSMTSAANHQPVLVSQAQRNAQDDCTCFFTK